MSEETPERSQKVPSGCPSPARVEKTDSSSSRRSASPDHWDAEPASDSRNCSGRVRPSSWDDSDDDSSPQPELPDASSRPQETKAPKGSITSELNELKEQFFQSLEKDSSGNDSARIQNLREKLELKLKCDRRQSPARVRRRSRSSSSSSPVPETKSSPEAKERAAEEPEEPDASPKTSDLDSRYYLNNFFSELRSKRISMLDAAPVAERTDREDELMCERMKLDMLNELQTLEMSEDGGYFCKTSRKLSQILEVEENRKELEKSSEENLVKPEPVTTEVEKVEKSEYSPLQTARSPKSEKVPESSRESRQKRREGYKSLSFEEFGNFLGSAKVSRGSLSERSARIFGHKMDEDFIHLCAKSGKTRLRSPQRVESPGVEKPFELLTEKRVATPELPPEPSPKRVEVGKSSNECLRIDLTKATMSGSQTPDRSSVRSEHSHTSRTKSGKSRSGSNPQSPKFLLNIGDSGRSQKAEEGNTPEQQSKERESKAVVESRMSSEDGSGRRSNRSSYRSEGNSDRKLHLTLNSPSVESVKSSRSVSDRGMAPSTVRSGRSSRRSEKKWEAVATSGREENSACEKEESSPPAGSSRSLRKVSSASNRSGSSTKSLKSPKAPEEGFNCGTDAVTPRSQEIPGLELSLQITERPESQKASCRSVTTAELNSDMKTPNAMPSESNFSARSRKSGRSKRSTGRSVKRPGTARPNSSSSVRSNSAEEEEPRAATFEAVYEALMKEVPVSSGRRGGSWREIDVGSQQPSSRSENLERTPENSAIRKTFTPTPRDALEERLFSSRKSSARSEDSCGKTTVASSFGNVSPSKSERIKSRPSSWTSEERRFADIPPDVEKLDIDAISGRTTSRSFVSEEDEKDENPSSRRSRSGTESDLHSNKRLSIINEASLEDFQISNITEKEEKDAWEGPRPPSRRDSRRVSARSIKSDKTTSASPKAPAESWNGPPPGKDSSPDGTWSDLIETFEGGSNPLLFSEKNFPGFPPPEESFVRLSKHSSPEEAFDNSENLSLKLSRRPAEGKIEAPKSEMSQTLGMGKDQQEDLSFSLVYGESFAEKVKLEEDNSAPQQLYYVDVDKGGHFGMGEFGDMSCWSAGKSDHQDLAKPQDHGDGMEGFKSSEVVVKPEKREKETKTLRQLWTELKEDFRDARFLSSEVFPGTGSDADLTRMIPVGLKTSKSDNCIGRKLQEGSEWQSSGTYEFLGEYRWERGGSRVHRGSRERGATPGWRGAVGRYSSGSVSSPKEDFGGSEFEYERTPRLSRSMSDVQSQLRGEKYKSREVEEGPNSLRGRLTEKFELGREDKQCVDLDLILSREDEESAEKASKWLSLKGQERKKSSRRDKKGKMKPAKSSSSSGEPLVQYLSSRKSRSSVPSLKLRNSNCFQNFYKRFISVFCVTSNSSAATSK